MLQTILKNNDLCLKMIIFPGLQKQMLFMRCAYESQVEHLTIFPFPGLKIINIRGKA